jgi:uncharacterized membrane protein
LDGLFWTLIGLVIVAIIYGLYRLCFVCCRKGRDGYTEVRNDDNT